MKNNMNAFMFGVMFTVGTYVGKTLIEVADKAITNGLYNAGKNGNEYAQKACEHLGIIIDNSKPTENTVIGFKVD